jgi:hypothetical protein
MPLRAAQEDTTARVTFIRETAAEIAAPREVGID